MAGGVSAGRLNIEIVAEIARLQQDLDKAKRAVKAASGDIAASARAANDNLAGMASGIGKAGNQSKLAGHHMQNLAFQLQDIAIGLQGGQKPMTVFLQQGSQIAGIMAQAQMGVLGMTKAIAGMGVAFVASNPLILAAVGVAGLLAAGLGLVTEEINKNSSVTVTWKDVLLGAFDVVSNAVSSTVTSAFQAMGLDIGEVWESVKKYTKAAINFIIGAALAVPKLIAATYDKIGPAFGDAFYSAANIAIEALNWLVQKSAVPLNMLIKAMNGVFGTSIPEVVLGGIDKLANPYAGAMGALGKAGAQSLVSSFTTDYVGNIASALSDASQNRARLREAAEKAGEKAGKAGGAKMGKAMAEKAAKEVEDRFGVELTKAVKKLTDAFAKAGANDLANILEDISTNASRRIAGWESEANAVADYNEQLYILGEQLRGLKGLAGGLGGFIGALEGFRTGGSTGLGGSAGFLLDQLTKIQWVTQDENGRLITRIGDVFDDALKSVFGPNGSFKDLLQGAGTGIAAGQVFLGNQNKSGQIGSAIGGALGEAVGKEFFSKLGSFAGPVGSIVGGILGGVVGGLVKKTRTASATITGVDSVSLSGKKKGSYDDASSLAGSVLDGLQQIADAFGAEIGSFNTSIGLRGKDIRVNTSNSSLKSKNGAVSFGEDAAAAVAYAMMDAIKDGAFKGLSKGVENLLTKSGGDLEKQLQKALDFKAVFDYVEQQSDPMAYALKQLGTELDYLKGVFNEAGASASDLAKLEEYSALRRTEIMDQYSKAAEEAEKAAELLNQRRTLEVQIMTMQGSVSAALALARSMELEAMDESLRPLQEQIYALADANQKRQLEIQLLEALGLATEAEAARRQDYLNTLPESLRGLQMQIYAAQDAKTAAEAAAEAQEQYNSALAGAKNDLISAYNREASALQQTIDRFRNFGDSLREFRSSLYGVDGGLNATRNLLVNLMKVGAQAGAGSESAMSALPGAGRDYLSSLRNTAGSYLEYQRGVAMVARYTNDAIKAADSAAGGAAAQLRALEKQVTALVNIEEDTLTVAEAIARVKELLESPVVPAEPTPVALPEDYVTASYDAQQQTNDTLASIERTQDRRLDQLSSQVERLTAVVTTLSGNVATSTGILKRAERSGGTLATVDETP